MNTINKFSYQLSNGIVKGDFNIFQGKNGAIYLALGKKSIILEKEQIDELAIPCYDLIDFNHDLFLNFYKK